jgi:hypothetical protein
MVPGTDFGGGVWPQATVLQALADACRWGVPGTGTIFALPCLDAMRPRAT